MKDDDIAKDTKTDVQEISHLTWQCESLVGDLHCYHKMGLLLVETYSEMDTMTFKVSIKIPLK